MDGAWWCVGCVRRLDRLAVATIGCLLRLEGSSTFRGRVSCDTVSLHVRPSHSCGTACIPLPGATLQRSRMVMDIIREPAARYVRVARGAGRTWHRSHHRLARCPARVPVERLLDS